MTIAEGRWLPDHETGDDWPYPNLHRLDELESIASDAFDVVIVGGGGAGYVAAIEAADRGASVLVLEKMASPGGSTAVSGGTIRLVSDPSGTAEHFWYLAQGATPRATIDAFVEGLVEIPDWVAAHGGKIIERKEGERGHSDDPRLFPISRPGSSFPNFPSAGALAPRGLVEPTRPGREGGAALWDFLASNLAERDVPVVLGARVVGLTEEASSRRVTGVEVEGPHGTITIGANRAVLLACGGFAYDAQTMTQYYGLALPTVCPIERATGDGIRLAQELGADLWHMNVVAASVGLKPAELDAGFQCKMPAYGFVMVDQLARRYVNETGLENHSAVLTMLVQDVLTGEYLRAPSFVIFDETTRLSGRVGYVPHGENRHYPWSYDNSEEVARGWIQRAESIGSLAEQLGLPVEGLEATVTAFNDAAEERRDDSQGRPPQQMRPIVRAPFYGAAVYPIIVNTQGGPRRNGDGQILRPDGSPIPGLYSAGELGSLWNRLYPGAGNLCECIVSGRRAIKHALA